MAEMKTVCLTLDGLYQSAVPFDGIFRVKLNRAAICEEHKVCVLPKEWQEIKFTADGVATVDLIPNSMFDEGSFYEFEIKCRLNTGAYVYDKYGKWKCITKGVFVVPDRDCNFSEIATVRPMVDEPIEAAKAYASEAKECVNKVSQVVADFGEELDAEKEARAQGDADTLTEANKHADGLTSALSDDLDNHIATEKEAREQGDKDTLANAKKYTDDIAKKIDLTPYAKKGEDNTFTGKNTFEGAAGFKTILANDKTTQGSQTFDSIKIKKSDGTDGAMIDFGEANSGDGGIVRGLQNPQQIYDATNKFYVDAAVSNLANTKASNKALADGLATKADKAHTHEIADVEGLQNALEAKASTADLATAKSELQTAIAGKADKIPEGYGKWVIADDPTKGSIYVKDGMTLGIDWSIDRFTALFIYPVIRCPYAEQFFPSLISAPYHMRFRYVPATQATSSNSIRMVLPFMLGSLIDEDTGMKTYGDGNSSFSINFSSADDTNTPREFEITRYDYEGQTPVCVVRMRKI